MTISSTENCHRLHNHRCRLVFWYALSLWKHGKNDHALSVMRILVASIKSLEPRLASTYIHINDLVVALAKEDAVKFTNNVKEFDGVTKVPSCKKERLVVFDVSHQVVYDYRNVKQKLQSF
ncbi:hypothetical protein Tco_0129250 [Tanacetum coccineum]